MLTLKYGFVHTCLQIRDFFISKLSDMRLANVKNMNAKKENR